MEHALPRTWSLCMTSENHGTVGPAGCTFSHAPEKHERVLVVEVPSGAGAPADQINLRLVGARKVLPVAEFEGYVDGEPLVRWMDRDNMPRVGTKLFAAPVAAQAGQVAVPGWISVDERLPSVPANSDRQFIIACQRANGKTHVFAASYLNALELDSNNDGESVFTGWHTEGEHAEYSSWYEPVCQAGDKVTHWQELPAAPSPAKESK